MRLLISLFILFPFHTIGQACSTIPGMTPSTAILVCGTTVFNQSSVNNCTGPNIPHTGCTAIVTSNNSFWYKFHCFQSGTKGFLIAPLSSSDDFDWEVTDITNHNPNDVYTDATLQVSLNLCGNPTGNTGCSASGTTDVNCDGTTAPFNSFLNLIAGHDYLLMVTNWSASGQGYNLSFSGGTGVIADASEPAITTINAGCNNITIQFSKDIRCSSVTASGSEFTIQPGNFPITNITSNCTPGVNSIIGLTINLQNYLPPGNYTLVVDKGTDANTFLDACSNAIQAGTAFPFIVKKPTADFTSGNPSCVGNTIQFTSSADPLSGNTITLWGWDFGDGTVFTGAQPNPTHTYIDSGYFTVKHWIVNSKGCRSDTAIHLIYITPLPVAGFTALPPAGFYCKGKDILFTSTATAINSTITNWNWNLGDGTLLNFTNGNPFAHQYSTTGIFHVTLVVSTDKGCVSMVFSRDITVNNSPIASFSHSRVCLPDGISSFINNSSISNATPLSFYWNFGDPASGTNNSSGLNNPVHYFSTTGPYIVQLIATSNAGCMDTVSMPVADIYQQAHADFTVLPENCINDATAFISNSNPLTGNTTIGWFWDFGDLSGAAIQNPSHTYAAAGSYTVKHWILTDKNCTSDTMVKTIVVNPLPTANFSFAFPACQAKQINFTDHSIANAGAVNTWQWDFGDGNFSGLQHPAHVYTNAGAYLVSLKVTSTKGCTGTVVSQQISVDPQPVAGFINPEVCLTDASAIFIDTSTVAPPGIINSWLWNFGDPASGALNNSTLPNPVHKYNAIGLYTASLTVTTVKGCTHTISQSFTVNGDIPKADFNVLNPLLLCANDSVAIQDASSVNFGNITKTEIYWDNVNLPFVFQKDDNPFPGKIYHHAYPVFHSPLTKTFSIRLRSYSGATCINEIIRTVLVNASPLLQFNAMPNTCLNVLPFQITQAGEIAGVPGSGIYSGSGVSPTGIFNPAVAGPGIFRILYTYSSAAAGCRDTISNTITVLAPPVSDFNFSTPVCETKNILFTSTASTPVGSLSTFTWNFGDGTPIMIRNNPASFSHVFSNAGTYTVSLTVTTSNGCISLAKSYPVLVRAQPTPGFSFSASSCLPTANVQFTDGSVISDGTQNQFTFLWNFGDPASGINNQSTAKNPLHTYYATGPYSINLQVTSGAGCTQDTTLMLNTIHPQPKAAFNINNPAICLGAITSFTDASTNGGAAITNWYWNLGDGTVHSNQNVLHQYNLTARFVVSLYIKNAFGCNSDTVVQSISVYPYPVVNAGKDLFVLEGDLVQPQPAVSGNGVQYLWSPNINLFNNDNTILLPSFRGVKDMYYTLTVTAQGGCALSDEIFVKVLKAPLIPNTFTPNGDGINEKWLIQYLNDYPDCRVQVFTRTGQLVYQSARGYNIPWDGNRNGKALPLDTYYYIIEPGNGRKPLTGFVTIVK
jgi:gliding motility-associated-like protein